MTIRGRTSNMLSSAALIRDRLLNNLRRRLKVKTIIALIRILRALIHFGPWRIIPQQLIRWNRKASNKNQSVNSLFFNHVNFKCINDELHNNSVSIMGCLPPDMVKRIRSASDNLPVNHYQLIHRIDPDVHSLVQDPAIQKVLQDYFGCEPVLLESTLIITGDVNEHGFHEQNHYHYDFAGWQSLNLFVYLTEVEAESSYHVVVKGSHKSLKLMDRFRATMSDDQVDRQFGENVFPVLGPAGMVFFENTEALHKRMPGKGRRAMLNILFASHKSLLSHGRTSESHIRNRARVYENYRT